MTKKTAKPKPTLPASGGSWRLEKGRLTRAAAAPAAQSADNAQAAAAPKKEA